jgi:hypothetical protein
MKKSGCSAAKYTCDPKKPRNNKGEIEYKDDTQGRAKRFKKRVGGDMQTKMMTIAKKKTILSTLSMYT